MDLASFWGGFGTYVAALLRGTRAHDAGSRRHGERGELRAGALGAAAVAVAAALARHGACDGEREEPERDDGHARPREQGRGEHAPRGGARSGGVEQRVEAEEERS